MPGGAPGSAWLSKSGGMSSGVDCPSIQNIRTLNSVKPPMVNGTMLCVPLAKLDSANSWNMSVGGQPGHVAAGKTKVLFPTIVNPKGSENPRPGLMAPPDTIPDRFAKLLAGGLGPYRKLPSAFTPASGEAESYVNAPDTVLPLNIPARVGSLPTARAGPVGTS